MDDKELDRIDLCHVKYSALLDKHLFFAPIEDPQRILDLGCGTGKGCISSWNVRAMLTGDIGIWCIDMAEEYPGAQVRHMYPIIMPTTRMANRYLCLRSSELTLHLRSRNGRTCSR
jgi:hypothetical protein